MEVVDPHRVEDQAMDVTPVAIPQIPEICNSKLINKETTSGDFRDLESLTVIDVPTDDRNNGSLDLVFRFDRDLFLPKSSVRNAGKECHNDELPHSGSASNPQEIKLILLVKMSHHL